MNNPGTTAKKLLVRAAAESQVGNARGHNEDNVYFNGEYITPRTLRQDFAIETGEYSDVNCFAVLDGMGRNNTGSFASLQAAMHLDEVADRVAFDTTVDTDTVVLDYIQRTNADIRDQIHETGGVRTASTLALLIIENETAHAYNAGDSRIYLFRDKQLIKLSRDHVAVRGQRSVALTEEGVRNGGLTKYLGMPESEGSLEPYRAKPFKVKKGDKFIICSDGITDCIDEEEIANCLARRMNPFGHVNELMGAALTSDNNDNVSVIVVEIVEPGFHITQNMILAGLGCAVLTVGLLAGGVLGYIIGAGSVDRNTGFVEYTSEIQHITTTAPPPALVSGGDVSGGDVSGADVPGTDGGTTAQTSRTQHPTTTYPTTTTAPYPVESFTIYPRDFTMKVGKTQTITVTVYPEELDLPPEAIHWKSSNESVATVDQFGTITAVSRGKAIISATIYGASEDDNQIEECTVYVVKK